MTTFSYTPSYSAQATRKPVNRTISFGDGYEQRRRDGINRFREIWDLSFNNRTTAEANGIEAILKAAEGVDYFTWTTPDGVTGKFICKDWTRVLARGNMETITCQFKQVFDPA